MGANMRPLKRLWKIALCATVVLSILAIDFVSADEEAVSTEPPDVTVTSTTIEPEGSPGCNPPDIRLTKPRQRSSMTTTSAPILTFETTQIYLPDDFTTGDLEFINHNKDAIRAAFRNGNTGELLVDDIGVEDDLSLHYVNYSPYTWNDEKKNFEHSKSPSKRTRREAISFPSSSILKLRRDSHGVLTISEGSAAGRGRRLRRRSLAKSDYEMERIYIQSTDLVSSLQQSPNGADSAPAAHPSSDREANSDYDDNQIKATNRTNDANGEGPQTGNGTVSSDSRLPMQNASARPLIVQHPEATASLSNREHGVEQAEEKARTNSGLDGPSNNGTFSKGSELRRVKRKSGKTTGALSRPKSDSGSSSSKTTSRKTQLGVDEETEYRVPHPDGDQLESSKEEETEDLSEGNAFREVTEVRFPSEVGPMGDRRLCKIICSGGKWVGPLCASLDDDEPGTYKFQPLYKSCHVNRIPPHLLLSYRNISVSVGWDVPHGHSLQARCSDLGMYKLLGESRVLCSNGLWAPRMPSCVPTTLLTNYSDDSPPSIRIKVGVGSGSFEPSGVLAVLPSSSVHFDCMYPRRKGNPEWTWTGWFRQYITGWSVVPEEKATRYRLTIKDIQAQDSGTYTCATPRGLTNSIVIVVAVSICSTIPEPNAPLQLRLEGNKLGQRALYRCPVGYTLEGVSNSTCLASGNWSSATPSCHPVQCPPLYLEEPHLSLVELNSSAWGRAVFKCAWGYRLNGPSALECETAGVWSGPVPRCRAIQCPQPLIPINGRIDGTSQRTNERRYAVGALITFSCTEGHLLVGEASIVCTETGFWSHPPPFCKAQCPYPGDPPNGLIAPLKFHYDPGDYLTVQCRPGFVNNFGPSNRPHCLSEGIWSGPVPTCRNYEDV